MQDIKQYIESGILELYVLDSLTMEEKRDVENMAAIHPAIRMELNEIAETMELFAEQNAVEPFERLRSAVLDQLINVSTSDQNTVTQQPIIQQDKKVVALKPVPSNVYFYKYAFAASIALLLVSLVALFNTYNSLQESKQQLVSLQATNQKFANQVNYQENQLNQLKKQAGETPLQKPVFIDSSQVKSNNSTQLVALESQLKESKVKLIALERLNKNREKELNIVSDPAIRFIKLKSVSKVPSQMLIAWNPEKNQLWINKKASTLPKNDREHQYQLWAITKLKPVSLGVFDVRKADSIMEKMTSVDRATAFAVTLEPRGGSEKPTLKQMMVMGLSHK